MRAKERSASLRVTITRLIHDGTYPDWIEAEFTDTDGKNWILREKVPSLGIEDEDVEYLPAPFEMPCRVLEERLSQTGELLKRITLEEEPYVISESSRHALTCWVRASDLSDGWAEDQK
ncbi:hypothetical protein [Deinococcus radiopugnans]|uniref:hypothetical protein n=1 Tax=Deinococcus radiopugnans TaxID=57497 RepID=UPI0012E086D8|nr:hypothetical protein [Deinococcus radiopugnans]